MGGAEHETDLSGVDTRLSRVDAKRPAESSPDLSASVPTLVPDPDWKPPPNESLPYVMPSGEQRMLKWWGLNGVGRHPRWDRP